MLAASLSSCNRILDESLAKFEAECEAHSAWLHAFARTLLVTKSASLEQGKRKRSASSESDHVDVTRDVARKATHGPVLNKEVDECNRTKKRKTDLEDIESASLKPSEKSDEGSDDEDFRPVKPRNDVRAKRDDENALPIILSQFDIITSNNHSISKIAPRISSDSTHNVIHISSPPPPFRAIEKPLPISELRKNVRIDIAPTQISIPSPRQIFSNDPQFKSLMLLSIENLKKDLSRLNEKRKTALTSAAGQLLKTPAKVSRVVTNHIESSSPTRKPAVNVDRVDETSDMDVDTDDRPQIVEDVNETSGAKEVFKADKVSKIDQPASAQVNEAAILDVENLDIEPIASVPTGEYNHPSKEVDDIVDTLDEDDDVIEVLDSDPPHASKNGKSKAFTAKTKVKEPMHEVKPTEATTPAVISSSLNKHVGATTLKREVKKAGTTDQRIERVQQRRMEEEVKRVEEAKRREEDKARKADTTTKKDDEKRKQKAVEKQPVQKAVVVEKAKAKANTKVDSVSSNGSMPGPRSYVPVPEPTPSNDGSTNSQNPGWMLSASILKNSPVVAKAGFTTPVAPMYPPILNPILDLDGMTYTNTAHNATIGAASATIRAVSGKRGGSGKSRKKSGPTTIVDDKGELPEIDSDEEDLDSEDSDLEERDNKTNNKGPVPSWAETPNLLDSLKDQQARDPDNIFGSVKPIQLEEVFRGYKKDRKFRPRTSSANWTGVDELTGQEEESYKQRMGFLQ